MHQNVHLLLVMKHLLSVPNAAQDQRFQLHTVLQISEHRYQELGDV